MPRGGSWVLRPVLGVLLLFSGIACESGDGAATDVDGGSAHADGGGTAGSDAAAETASPSAGCGEEIGPSQPLSAACCVDHGVDACGAGLFCEAFDGRTQTTCYPEHSRADREECSADVQCLSDSCNLAVGRCRSVPTTICEREIGCAKDAQERRYACHGDDRPACELVADEPGDGGAPCLDADDCRGGRCGDERGCVGIGGESCTFGADCQSGFCEDGACRANEGQPCTWAYGAVACWSPTSCAPCSASNTHCEDDAHDYECLCWIPDESGYEGDYGACPP